MSVLGFRFRETTNYCRAAVASLAPVAAKAAASTADMHDVGAVS